MNFTTRRKDILKAVIDLLGVKVSHEGVVNFSVSYSQNRRLSIIVIELSRSQNFHALIFIYNRALNLYDVQNYRPKNFHRVPFQGDSFKKIDFVNKFILKNISHINMIPSYKLKEEVEKKMKDDVKDYKIKSLKNQLRITRDTIKSLRDQLRNLKNQS